MSDSSFAQSLSPAQREQLIALLDECRVLGATSAQLGPLCGALGIFSPEDKDSMWDEAPTFHD